MAQRRMNLLQSMGRAVHELDDAEMLRRFVEHRDTAAFEVLVWRHGSAVYATCRRMLGDRHLAEDALQATFLLLSQKASTIREARQLAGWLHRTACRVCWRANKLPRTEPLTIDPLATAKSTLEPDTAAIIDAEVNRLPERFRHVVVLCYLEGRTADETAKLLNVPRGTVLSRLATARAKLGVRLAKRGLAPALAVALMNDQLSAGLVQQCVTIGCHSTVAVTTIPYLLAQGVIQMSLRKIVLAWSLALVSVAGVGTSVAVVATAGDEPGKSANAKVVDDPLSTPIPPLTATDERMEATRQAMNDLRGTWKLVAVSADGKNNKPVPDNTLIFEKEYVTTAEEPDKMRWIPAKIDDVYQLTFYDQDHIRLMIYELNKDVLKLGMYRRPAVHRPKSFDLKDKLEGETLMVATFKRIAPPVPEAESPSKEELQAELRTLQDQSRYFDSMLIESFTRQDQLEADIRLVERVNPPRVLLQSKQAALAAVEEELVKAEVKLIETEARRENLKALIQDGQISSTEMIPIVVQPKIVEHLKQQRAKLQAELMKETQPSPELERINEKLRKLLDDRQKSVKEGEESMKRRTMIQKQLEKFPSN